VNENARCCSVFRVDLERGKNLRKEAISGFIRAEFAGFKRRAPRRISASRDHRFRVAATLGVEARSSGCMVPAPEKPSDGAPKPGHTARAAALVTAGIFLSRLFGLLRQRVIAHYFGTSPFADVLAAAFRVGNITQNLLGEGTLSASFIPVYAKLRGAGKGREAVRFALAALGLLIAAVALVSIVGILAAPWLTWLIAAGFDEQKLGSTAGIVRIVFPMTGLLVLSAWGLGVLNAHRRFFLPYAAPVVWSLAQIAGLVLAGSWLSLRGQPLAHALAWSALAGAGLQLLLLLPAARSLLGSLRPRFDTKDPAVGEAARRLPAAIAGRGIIQISGLVDNLLVSFLGTGAIAVFGYAQTIYLLPMSLLGTGEAAAALPEMARETADEDLARRNAALRARLGASMARITTLTLPAMAAFGLLGREIITLFYQGGSFVRSDTARVEPILAAYGLALLGNASGRVFGTTCFALGDTKTPARYALVRVLVSTAIALALMRSLGVLGVVLGAVTAGWVEAIALGLRVRTAIGGLGLEQVRIGRIVALAGISVGAGLGTRAVLPARMTEGILGSMAVLAAFGVVFLIAARVLKLFSLRSLTRRA
jgi:putative peptidoglycan lipid II flippase